jgi:hypothetical protein
MYKQSFLQTIIAEFKTLVNQFALDRITEYEYIDPEKTLQAMKEYNDENLGTYAFRTFFSH